MFSKAREPKLESILEDPHHRKTKHARKSGALRQSGANAVGLFGTNPDIPYEDSEVGTPTGLKE